MNSVRSLLHWTQLDPTGPTTCRPTWTRYSAPDWAGNIGWWIWWLRPPFFLSHFFQKINSCGTFLLRILKVSPPVGPLLILRRFELTGMVKNCKESSLGHVQNVPAKLHLSKDIDFTCHSVVIIASFHACGNGGFFGIYISLPEGMAENKNWVPLFTRHFPRQNYIFRGLQRHQFIRLEGTRNQFEAQARDDHTRHIGNLRPSHFWDSWNGVQCVHTAHFGEILSKIWVQEGILPQDVTCFPTKD